MGPHVVYGGSRQLLENVVLRIVYDDDGVLLSKARLAHVQRHSPDGFEWGYSGSGPADLALSILTDAVGPGMAEACYQHFKDAIVARLDREVWALNRDEVRAWVAFHTDAAAEPGRHLSLLRGDG